MYGNVCYKSFVEHDYKGWMALFMLWGYLSDAEKTTWLLTSKVLFILLLLLLIIHAVGV